MKLDAIAKSFRIDKPDKFRLSKHDPANTGGLDIDKDDAKKMLAGSVERLRGLQEKLYADGRWSVLIVVQAMDAAGKDGLIEHMMSGVNPQGVDVRAFKQPSAEELKHDFLWRIAKALPEQGRIGIFNRSHYEEVLTVRVHPEFLAAQKLPKESSGKDIWKQRFKDIRSFEQHLARNGTLILKFFLNVSREEQRKRFLDRIEEPAKRWKFSMGDVAERKLWPKYMDAYEDVIRETSRPEAPWFVVPADNKWFTRIVVSQAVCDAIEKLDIDFPEVDARELKELKAVRDALKAEKS